MLTFTLSNHAKDMLKERNILEEWVWRTVNSPSETHTGEDGNTHYIKEIDEKEGRMLRVIVNPFVQPNRIVTVFFDHHLSKKKV
jgi:Domain of unknown function (DUF4258)